MTNYLNITYDSLVEVFIDKEKFVLPEMIADMQSIIDAVLNSRPSNVTCIYSVYQATSHDI